MRSRRKIIDTPSIIKRDFEMLLRVGVAVSVLGLLLGGTLLTIGLLSRESAIPVIAIGAAMLAQSLVSIGVMRAMLTIVIMQPISFESRPAATPEEDCDPGDSATR